MILESILKQQEAEDESLLLGGTPGRRMHIAKGTIPLTQGFMTY